MGHGAISHFKFVKQFFAKFLFYNMAKYAIQVDICVALVSKMCTIGRRAITFPGRAFHQVTDHGKKEDLDACWNYLKRLLLGSIGDRNSALMAICWFLIL